MDTVGKNTTNKTADTWTTEVDKIFTELGLTPKWGSVIMPASKHLQSVKQQQDSQEKTKKEKE